MITRRTGKRSIPSMWSNDDVELLREWINENPDINPGFKDGNKHLNELFPLRSPVSIYNRWRAERLSMIGEHGPFPFVGNYHKNGGKFHHNTTVKSQQNASVKQSNTQDNYDGRPWGHLFNDFIEGIVVNELTKQTDNNLKSLLPKITELQEENDRLKTILRKLTKVREAIEDFKL